MLTLGDVEILRERRQVLVGKQPFNLGSRAFDLLEVLVDAGGALVTKEEIIRRVWPNTVVVENNLHVHISAIRKMLGDEASRLVSIPGRGYRLVLDAAQTAPEPIQPAGEMHQVPSGLPMAQVTLIGRDTALADVLDACSRSALVTLAGPGGVGKTTLALCAARRLMPDFPDGVRLVELATVRGSNQITNQIANEITKATLRALGHDEATITLSQALNQKRMLIVLDNCEHVIDAAAHVALAIIAAAPQCAVLATSREPLRVPAEVVYRVAALDVPRQDESPRDAMQSGAVRLFIDRVRAGGRSFECDAHDVALIASICRRLDGMPLAIELAASRAATLGVRELAASLDDRFDLLTEGHRTALPHHRTLRANVDWSHDLLSATEQVVFRRLGVFASPFSLDAACALATDATISRADVLDAVCALTAKSLLAADMRPSIAQYSMLETCRAYAVSKLMDAGERDEIERRRVTYAGRGGALAISIARLSFAHFQAHPEHRSEHQPERAQATPRLFSVLDPSVLRAIANREPV